MNSGSPNQRVPIDTYRSSESGVNVTMGKCCIFSLLLAGLNAIWFTDPVNVTVMAVNLFTAGLSAAAWWIDRAERTAAR